MRKPKLFVSVVASMLAAAGALSAQAVGGVNQAQPAVLLSDAGDTSVLQLNPASVSHRIQSGSGFVLAYADCYEGGFWTVARWGTAVNGPAGTTSTAACVGGGSFAVGGWGWLN
jgi:hypothetical protein